MFERFTEKARRTIFFARYEASNLGSSLIETEHLLLGLLREDKELAARFLNSHAAADSVRQRITRGLPPPAKISTSVDMPLSHQCKRVLAYSAEEAFSIGDTVATEHILLGLLREEKGFAAEFLRGQGLDLTAVREKLQKSQLSPEVREKPQRRQIPPKVLEELQRMQLPPEVIEQLQRLPLSPVGRERRPGFGPVGFKLMAANPNLTVADPANPTGFHENPGPGYGRWITCQNMTMAQFAENLPRIAPGYIRGHRVADETGLDGAWDFTLNFMPAGFADPGGISLFEALREQLGLILEPTPRPGPSSSSPGWTPPRFQL